MGIELNNDQLNAIISGEQWFKSKDSQIFEIAGSAGTGKTTIVKCLIEKLGLRLDQVLFVSFMGKAACRMAMDGLPAKTIHSAIYQYERDFLRDEDGHIVYKDNGRPKTVGQFILKDRIGKGIKLIVIDEGGMVSEKLAEDLLSFGIPVIVLGDLNQLPPVFGKAFFLKEPNVILRKIMRQSEGNPILYLANQVLEGRPLKVGEYGTSRVIRRSDLTETDLKQHEIILTDTNRTRWNLNSYYRTEIKRIKNLKYPQIGEKVICRKNNWSKKIGKNFFLTNGMSGYVRDIFRSSYDGKTMIMDFQPDFLPTDVFTNLKFNYKYMYAPPMPAFDNPDDMPDFLKDIRTNRFEFAYAITVHLSQGSQYDSVLYLKEHGFNDNQVDSLTYTAITRAIKNVTIVV